MRVGLCPVTPVYRQRQVQLPLVRQIPRHFAASNACSFNTVSACDGRMDGQTDIIASACPRQQLRQQLLHTRLLASHMHDIVYLVRQDPTETKTAPRRKDGLATGNRLSNIRMLTYVQQLHSTCALWATYCKLCYCLRVRMYICVMCKLINADDPSDHRSQ